VRPRLCHFDIRAILSERTKKTLKRAQGRHPKKEAEKRGREEKTARKC